MITDENHKISIIAYYLSKYDKDALTHLGFEKYTDAFSQLSAKFGKSNNYMKLRRDEFDAIVSTVRQGWNKRAPAAAVLRIHEELKGFSFIELSNVIDALLSDNLETEQLQVLHTDRKIITSFSEEEYERLINSVDISADIKRKTGIINERIYDRKIPDSLKKLYNYRCQICGATAKEMYGVDVSEAHHISPFTKSINNNASNIVILCPDHHRIIHKANGVFDFNNHIFTYDNMKTESLMLNLHL